MLRHTLTPLAAALLTLSSLPGYANDDDKGGDAAKSATATATAAKPPASNLKPFADIIKDAKRQDGLFPIWRKDDKAWLEVPADGFDRPFFFSIGRSHALGERGVYGGQMGASHVASFRRIGDRVQLLAHNLTFTATEKTPQSHAVREGFSDSLLSSTTAVSQPHPERKSVLIDANALLLSDIPAGAYLLESAFRLAYSFDAKQSAIVASRSDERISALQVSAHYQLSKLPLPDPAPSTGGTPTPRPTRPRNLQDPRSLFLGYHYSFAALPEPMATRLADDRIGHFTTRRWDYGNDINAAGPRVYYVNRWRLEKADPNAAISEPKEPVVYWLDRNIPVGYRQAITEGVLAWNLAFEKIGIRNALVVKQQGEDDEFHTAEARRASIRWFIGSDVGFAIGPSRTDPRTGEILDADIALSDVFARGARREVSEELPPTAFGHQHEANCGYLHLAGQELAFGLDLLEARGEIAPDSPAADEHVKRVLRDLTMHEVGHTLGLRHDFRSSSIYSAKQLADKSFTARMGIAGSVMDYQPTNIALPGEPQGSYGMETLGPYDYWAIEYAYKPIAPADEAKELARIASRSTEPLLASATDEDAGDREDGMDPAVNRFDLSDDPLAYYQKRMQLSRELWTRWQNKPQAAGSSHAVVRRNVERGLRQIQRVAELSTKYIGGLTHLRDHAGSGRAPLTPIAAEQQRRALQLITDGIFMPRSFELSPEFQLRLVPDYLDRRELNQSVEFGLSERVQTVQASVLTRLFEGDMARRLLEFPGAAAAGSKAAPFTLAELHDQLRQAIWKEASMAGEVPVMRRNLQREHLKHLVRLLTRPGNNPADVVALTRSNARLLAAQLQTASQRRGLSPESSSHYADAAATLQEALKASYNRT